MSMRNIVSVLCEHFIKICTVIAEKLKNHALYQSVYTWDIDEKYS